MSQLSSLKTELRTYITPGKPEGLARFFKTGEGQYGYGDKFLGVMVPGSKIVAAKYKDISLKEVEELMQSSWHEERFIALLILDLKFSKAEESVKKEIYDFYLSHTKYINNWDLVDSSASQIVGQYLIDKPKDILYKLAKSDSLWEKRIAIIATFAFIHNKEYKETFKIAELLLNDTHDLIHKAVGWMLREAGKACGNNIEEEFLNKHYKQMPRTMLRYSIERFEPDRKKFYMAK